MVIKMDILSYTAVELSAAIKEGKTTAVEATRAVLAQIEQTEELLNCYVTIDKEKALAAAEAVQKRIENGELTGHWPVFRLP